MEFDPKLNAEAAPVRLVGAASERGPIGPSTPAQTLTKASKDRVSQARREVSKLDENRPVPKVDYFGAIASIAGSVGQGLNAFGVGSQANVSQADKDNTALKPLAQKLAKLQTARQQGKRGINAQISLETTSFIVNNPRLERQALDLAKNLTGVDSLVKEELSVEDINISNQNKWLKDTAAGRVTAARAADKSPAEQSVFIEKEYNRSVVQELTIENAKVRLDTVKDDQELLKIESDVQSQQIAKDQSLQIQELMTNEILPETVDADEELNVLEEITALRELRQLKAAEFANEYGVGVLPADIEARIGEVMKPIDRLIGMLEANGEDIQQLARVQGAQAVLDMGKILQDENFGPIFQTPDGIKALTQAMIYNKQFDIARVAKVYNEKYKIADDGKISEAPVSDEGDTSSTLVDEAKDFYKENIAERRSALNVNSDILNGIELETPEDIQLAFDTGIEMIGLISAGDDTLDDDSFTRFVDQNLFKMVQLATLPGEQGEQFTRALNGMLVKQMAINTWDTKQLAKNLPAGFFVSYDNKFKLEFNLEAFNNAEDQITSRVKTLLEQNGLPVVEENIRAVVENPIAFTKEASGLNNRKFASDTSVSILANSGFKGIQSKINRLNIIDNTAKNVPTIKNWEVEANAAVIRPEKAFRESVLTNTAIVKEEDFKETQKKRESYPKFDSAVGVEEALTKGDIQLGDLVYIDGEIYVVEE